MTPIRWIVFAVVCVLTLAGLVVFTGRDDVDISDVDPNSIITAEPIADHVYGNAEADVLMVEYGDFQCPGCGSLFPTLKTVKEAYKDQMAFVFRNFPLTSIHPNALAAATAAEAAGLQGKYYEMHDQLFQNQDSWSTAGAEERTTFFVTYAQQIGLNVDQFETDLSSEDIRQKIDRDRALAERQGANSTPTLLINGEAIGSDVWQDEAKLRSRIEQAIKDTGGTVTEADESKE